ncbi:immunoglobulin-like domain-containing protein [Vreelandella piezotolerans]|uniref:immunoglobulin-like domain-containing protein n=1 Tax=Vreelandella piezotolerans TaxID=2609667 RepID=UPI003BF4C017
MLTITLSNGQQITIAVGETTGSVTFESVRRLRSTGQQGTDTLNLSIESADGNEGTDTLNLSIESAAGGNYDEALDSDATVRCHHQR